MNKLVHCGQTGFMCTLLATDHVRQLPHISYCATNFESPDAVLSLDAMKAFDHIEWPYLWSVVSTISFGEAFINVIKVLYANPSAILLTWEELLFFVFKYPEVQETERFKVTTVSAAVCPLS